MRHLVLASAAICMLPYVAIFAADAPTTQSAGKGAGLVIQPGPEIILTAGERVDLSIFDVNVKKPLNAGKVTWTINEQPMAQANRSAGELTPQAATSQAVMTYKAPTRALGAKPISVAAIVNDAGATAKLMTKITIADAPNWFALEGDTGVGPQNVILQLDPKAPSTAGIYSGPIALLKGDFVISLNGTVKGNPNSSVEIGINLANNSQPGTYTWSVGKPAVTTSITYFSAQKYYLSVDMDASAHPVSLEGSTTLLKPDPSDPPGLVKGFYSGRLRWVEAMVQVKPGAQTSHYLNVRGHFAIPGTGTPAASRGP